MSLTIIALIILIGLLLVVTEVFLVPGTTFVGIAGILIVAIGVYYSFANFGFSTGAGTLVGAGLVIGLLTYIGLKRMSKSKFAVNEKLEGKVNEFDYSHINVGDEGITITALRPEGKAIINDDRVTVFSMEFYMDPETKIEVVKIKENKIFVKQKQ